MSMKEETLEKIDEIMERMAGDWTERTPLEKQRIIDELKEVLSTPR